MVFVMFSIPAVSSQNSWNGCKLLGIYLKCLELYKIGFYTSCMFLKHKFKWLILITGRHDNAKSCRLDMAMMNIF